MKLTKEEAQSVIWEDTSEWVKIYDEVTDTSRWSIYNEGVFKHIPTNKHYMFNWSVGATEMQDESPFEYDDFVEPIEVEEKEVTVMKWIKKD